MLFKAGRQPAFTELQANDTMPLEFLKHEEEVSQRFAEFESGEESGKFFEGVPSSDMQPNSDAPFTVASYTSSDEGSD